ncbi:hypothetical protein [Gilvimarinus chinensis]|uniref:hypothetical protein n=1 Tax=Gilvimarinus chinensis TaxID=396005 RepID=UPI00036C39B1|nr:hypothetical protein [Gilvimarinus chinensis]
MSLEDLENMSIEELEAAGVDIDDQESLEAFLNDRQQPEREEDDETEQDDNENGDPSGQEQKEDPEPEDDEQAAAEDGDENEQDDEPEQYVATADGKGKIPYQVLKAKREEAIAYKSEIARQKEQLQEMQEKLDAAEAKSQNASKELEKHGIDISALQYGETLTDQQLEELADIDPSVAQMAKVTMAMYKKMQSMEQSIPQPQQNVSPERQAALNNPDLAQWIDGKDPDRWDMAVIIDSQVRQDPKFKDATVDEVFAEVAKRTKAAFGDSPTENKQRDTRSAAERAAEKVAAADTAPPTSLSQMGKSPSTEKSLAESLSEKSEDELVEMLVDGKISEEAYSQAIEELGGFQ